MSTHPYDDAEAAHRADMVDALHHAAARFGVTLAGPDLFGWRDRSIGAPVTDVENRPRWLRVVFEQTHWAGGDVWTGNADAAAITGLPKPAVLDVCEWHQPPETYRAELMTQITGQSCSPTPELRQPVDLPDSWWRDLRHALETLATTHTNRTSADQDTLTRRMLAFHGDEPDPTVAAWATAHGDLHWANLTRPELAILDWEHWGRGPAGLDAATLYCYSLLVPEVAAQVHETFADILDAPTGVQAQLHATARLLHRVDTGDHADLAGPLHRHAATLLRPGRCQARAGG